MRYVIVDTGKWLPGRLVLISPHAFDNFYQDGDSLFVNLTRLQIEDSPAIDMHKPVSRQYEEEYYRYYGWPTYWNGGGMSGMGGVPSVPPTPYDLPVAQFGASSGGHGHDDPHLRSTQAIVGYHIQTDGGSIGHVTDIMMDDQSWTIHRVVVETGHWFAGKEVAISPEHITRISYEDSKVFVDVTKESIQRAPEYDIPPLGAAYHDSHGFD